MRVPALSVLLCLSTCPDRATADRIAEALVGERLAACVSLLPGAQSVYRWEGRVERGEEVQLLIKTTHDAFAALRERLCALHPYEVPELIACEAVDGLPAYLDWIAAETTGHRG
ncbi:divalent cation tolerance protein CutA [Luteimonas yindakuii]|uniref:Divalent cation tolerance protein CutA n=1 Tax=Luteimonas yindakuii TaxID=2565782 RepID=A0A4Z1R9S8_9GAMM|nr:divalent-cation tolerance protein CutA [Luteimonas yindakuii]TKS52913.1 divalent cation tolerance protein CutA [Luteimonas yindakuii]